MMDLDLVPSWLNWARYGNVLLYSLQLFIHFIFPDDLEFTCVDSIHVGDTSHLGKGCKSVGSPPSPAVLSGYEARLRHKINFNPWLCIGFLIGMFVLSRLLAFILLWWDLRTTIDGATETKPSTQVSPFSWV